MNDKRIKTIATTLRLDIDIHEIVTKLAIQKDRTFARQVNRMLRIAIGEDLPSTTAAFPHPTTTSPHTTPPPAKRDIPQAPPGEPHYLDGSPIQHFPDGRKIPQNEYDKRKAYQDAHPEIYGVKPKDED